MWPRIGRVENTEIQLKSQSIAEFWFSHEHGFKFDQAKHLKLLFTSKACSRRLHFLQSNVLLHKIMKYFEVSSEIICCWLPGPGSWACFVLSTFCSLKVISSSFPPIRWDTQSWSELLLCYADILFTGAANPVLVRGGSGNFSSFIHSHYMYPVLIDLWLSLTTFTLYSIIFNQSYLTFFTQILPVTRLNNWK